jgi:hypothetical protein
MCVAIALHEMGTKYFPPTHDTHTAMNCSSLCPAPLCVKYVILWPVAILAKRHQVDIESFPESAIKQETDLPELLKDLYSTTLKPQLKNASFYSSIPGFKFQTP